MKTNYLITMVVVAAVIIFAVLMFSGGNTPKNQMSQTKQSTASGNTPENTVPPPEMQLEPEKDYRVVMKTSRGDVIIDLYEDLSPVTVNNFVFLAGSDFYNGTIFHRVIKDFMIQGGDPTGTGRGSPGYTFEDEFNEKKLVRGSLAMANAGPNTNGSQFFIVTAEEVPWLDGKHTNFGEVVEGLDVVLEIDSVEIGEADKPVEDVVIESIEIL